MNYQVSPELKMALIFLVPATLLLGVGISILKDSHTAGGGYVLAISAVLFGIGAYSLKGVSCQRNAVLFGNNGRQGIGPPEEMRPLLVMGG